MVSQFIVYCVGNIVIPEPWGHMLPCDRRSAIISSYVTISCSTSSVFFYTLSRSVRRWNNIYICCHCEWFIHVALLLFELSDTVLRCTHLHLFCMKKKRIIKTRSHSVSGLKDYLTFALNLGVTSVCTIVLELGTNNLLVF